MIGAEANRIATLNAAMPRAGKCNRLSIAALRAARLQYPKPPFSGGVPKGDSLFVKRITPLTRAALHALLSPSRPTGATQSLQTSLETESPKIRRASSSILLRCKDCKGINHVNSTAFPRRFQTPTIFPSSRMLGLTIPASVNTPRRTSSGTGLTASYTRASADQSQQRESAAGQVADNIDIA